MWEPPHTNTQLRLSNTAFNFYSSQVNVTLRPALIFIQYSMSSPPFLQQDSTHQALEPPYSGPYRVLSRREKTLQLLVCRRHVTVSADRVEPAYKLQETNRGNSINPPAAVTPTVGPPAMPTLFSTRTMCSGRHINFLACLNI